MLAVRVASIATFNTFPVNIPVELELKNNPPATPESPSEFQVQVCLKFPLSNVFVAVAEPRVDIAVLPSAKAGTNRSAAMAKISAVEIFFIVTRQFRWRSN